MSDENELKNIANPIGVDTSAWSPAADVNPAVPAWLIPNKLYDILKWLAALVFPALALFMGTVGPAWGLPYVDAIVTTEYSPVPSSEPAHSKPSSLSRRELYFRAIDWLQSTVNNSVLSGLWTGQGRISRIIDQTRFCRSSFY